MSGKTRTSGVAPNPATVQFIARCLSMRRSRDKMRAIAEQVRPNTYKRPEWYDPERLLCVKCLKEIRLGDRWAVSNGSRRGIAGYGRRYYHAKCWRTVGA